MRVAVVFDTPYSGWDHPDHERQMQREVGAWKADEPEMEYQIAHTLRERGQRQPLHQLRARHGNAAAKAGMDYGDFIQRIVDAAVTRYERS